MLIVLCITITYSEHSNHMTMTETTYIYIDVLSLGYFLCWNELLTNS